MAMAPTYLDWLLGKAGTGDRAYAMLEKIGTLSSSGKRQRQRVIDMGGRHQNQEKSLRDR